MLGKLELFRPEEIETIEVEIIEAFLGKTCARCERRRVSWERRKGKEGVFRAASDDAKVFRQGGSNGMDFLGDFLVSKGGFGVVLRGLHVRC